MRLPLVACLVLAGCTCGGGDPAASRPPCDSPDVVANVREIADAHPGYQPLFPARTKDLTEIRETSAREFPDVGSGSFRRLCVGKLSLENGETLDIGWEIFTTTTILGPMWGITACLSPYDPSGADCSVYAEGRVPGEPAP